MIRCLIVLILFLQTLNAGEIAVTIDDLPFVGNTHRDQGNLRREKQRFLAIMHTLQRYHVPAAGFVIPASVEKDQWQLIDDFYQSGNLIANHTYSHLNLNQTSAQRYIADIRKADHALSAYLSHPKYFRYPFLIQGRGAKKQQVKAFLAGQDYRIAPVTVDSQDYRFNMDLLAIPWRQRKSHIGEIKQQYLDFIGSQTQKAEALAEQRVHRPVKHILLLHMNLLNVYAMEDIIKFYQKRGYRFITLNEAMQDSYNNRGLEF